MSALNVCSVRAISFDLRRILLWKLKCKIITHLGSTRVHMKRNVQRMLSWKSLVFFTNIISTTFFNTRQIQQNL